ncbi:MAG: GrpB family protein [Proteobacteria bacterium]|nr:GrpB family protein [Pseudomonadota bacterium]MBI3499929.1 GrpB family protein [Pseudomonadota bacterium]
MTPLDFPVELLPHSPEWEIQARHEAERLGDALGERLIVVHHIGSTAIPGIAAKPILDLMPEFVSLPILDAAEPVLRRLGYEWWGEYGIPTRRYCTLADPQTGRRRINLHSFAQDSAEIERHLAFRDHLRLHPAKAREYEAVKQRCRDLHPTDLGAYTEAKGSWIKATELEALAFRRMRALGS